MIDYANFPEYVSIISQNNNWNEVFRSRFGRLHFVQESLYWTSQAFTDTLGWALEQGEDQWAIDGNRSMSD